MSVFSRVPGRSEKSEKHGAAARLGRAARCVLESLEARRLFAATVIQPLANTFGDPGAAGAPIDLNAHFNDPAASLVRLTTPSGSIDVKTLDQAAPLNAQNFLAYVNAGRYDNTYFHRSVISPTPFVLQGGSFYPDDTEAQTFPPVRSEPNGDRHNVRGTVAFARLPATDNAGNPIPGGGPDSATSGFFFNLADNSQNLDNQNGGFTVFGQVLGNGMQVVDALANVPNDQAKTARLINTATQLPDLAFSVTSSNTALVNPALNGNNLVLQYGPGSGTAQVTVTARDVDGGTVTGTFTAGVGQLDVTLGGQGGARSVSFTDADGTAATVSLAGGGTATVRFSGSGLSQASNKGRVTVSGTAPALNSVSVAGSTGSTSLTIAGRGGSNGTVALADLSTDGPARAISARTTDLTGSLTTGGAVRALDLGSATGATLNFGGPAGGGGGGGSALSIGTATDTSIVSNAPIRSLRTTSFAATGQTLGTITAPSIGSLTARGDFAQDVALSGALRTLTVGGNLAGEVTADSVGNATVRGNMTNAALNLTAPPGGRSLGSLKVGGSIANSAVRANGNVGSVSADTMTGSTVFAGVTGATLPTLFGEFAETPATISGVTVRTAFAGSNIAARNVGKLSLGTLNLNNGGNAFGVAADQIASLTGQIGPGVRFTLGRLDTEADLAAQAPGLNFQDARITLVEPPQG